MWRKVSPRGVRWLNVDHADEKPGAVQLEHVHRRVVDTAPLMFRQRLDYTFFRRDVFCDDQILRVQRRGIDQLQRHLGIIGSVGQMLFPHVELETMAVLPVVEDGTVRLRWRVKYVSFLRLLANPRLLRFDYRMRNLSWFDGYSVFSVDGNGDVFKVTLQKTIEDDGRLKATEPAKIERRIATQVANSGACR